MARPAPPDVTTGPSERTAAEILALGLIVALGLALRLRFMNEPVRSDEAYTYNEYATRSTYDAVSLYTFPNNHLLHTLFVHAAVRSLGGAPWVLRLPAFVAGVALIPATYLMTRRFAGGSAGLFAAALAAASDPLVSYSVNGRGYTMLALFTVGMAAAAKGLTTEGRWRDWAAFTLIPPLGFFTIPVMLYPYGGIVAWLLLAKLTGRARPMRVDRLITSGLFAGVLTLLAYAPSMARTGVESVVANKFVAPRPFAEVRRDLPGSLVDVWDQWNLDVPAPIKYGVVIAVVVGLVVRSEERAGLRAIFGLFLSVFAFSLAVVLYQSVVPFDRVWLFGLPLYQGVVGAGLGALTGRVRTRGYTPALAVLACVGLSVLVARSDVIPKDSARLTINHGPAIVELLRTRLGPDDAVVSELPCEGPLKYYFLVKNMPVEPLYDYRIARARRLYVVVNRPNGQTPDGVLAFSKVAVDKGRSPELLRDFGESAVYVFDR